VNEVRRHILLIEDNPGDARLIREMLAEAPVFDRQLTWTDTLARGLAFLAKGDVDVILLDLSLPDSYGLETFSAVHECGPAVPIVVLSGSTDEEVALAAVQEGAQDYLVKGRVDGYLLARSITYAIERKRNEEAQRYLSEASRSLSTSLDLEITLQNVTRLVVPLLADFCTIDLFDENGQPRHSVLAHRDPAQEVLLRANWRPFPPDVDAPGALASVLRSGEAAVCPDFTDSDFAIAASAGGQRLKEHALGIHSAMFVPLLARGRTLGIMCFFTAESSRRYDGVDLTLSTDIGRRATLAIDNAQLYRQATEAIRLRDTVLSSVSHDLRNPLTAIRLIAETVKLQIGQEQLLDIESIQEGLERIESNTQRMASQIDELLDVSHLQSGAKVHLSARSTDLVALARETIHDYQQRTSRHRILFETSADVVLGHWDRSRLERVLGNLLSNAIKYSLTAGEIVVRIWTTEDGATGWANIAVQDSGVGIPTADLPRVFDWFYRGDNVASKVAGAGIGLAGSRQIVELHGGTIHVESQEGVGSTFTVCLPLPPKTNDAPLDVES